MTEVYGLNRRRVRRTVRQCRGAAGGNVHLLFFLLSVTSTHSLENFPHFLAKAEGRKLLRETRSGPWLVSIGQYAADVVWTGGARGLNDIRTRIGGHKPGIRGPRWRTLRPLEARAQRWSRQRGTPSISSNFAELCLILLRHGRKRSSPGDSGTMKALLVHFPTFLKGPSSKDSKWRRKMRSYRSCVNLNSHNGLVGGCRCRRRRRRTCSWSRNQTAATFCRSVSCLDRGRQCRWRLVPTTSCRRRVEGERGCCRSYRWRC